MEGATEASASARDTDPGPAGGHATDHAQLRVAVAGAGFIGVVHAHAARRAGARLVGVAASSASSAREAAQALGADRGFADAESLVTA
ncbi:MAG: Gfo/Idh/MocA family oxidoreductase, partial [Candidatus Limnocylindrales bacterium]